jgi:hypothetical protein
MECAKRTGRYCGFVSRKGGPPKTRRTKGSSVVDRLIPGDSADEPRAP